MRAWEHGGGFSVDATVRVEAADRAGLERLLSYCARGPLALERLGRDREHPEVLVYQLPKPTPEGRTALARTPLELIDRLAALIPPPRVHRHRYSGVLAPSSPWRAQVTAWAAASAGAEAEPEPTRAPLVSPARGPPGWEEDFDQTPVFDPTAPAREPAYEFDQPVSG